MKTSLGAWAGLGNIISVMKFTGGQGCWQGPARSMTICCSALSRDDAAGKALALRSHVKRETGLSSVTCVICSALPEATCLFHVIGY